MLPVINFPFEDSIGVGRMGGWVGAKNCLSDGQPQLGERSQGSRKARAAGTAGERAGG
jgi:hypothetical protein